MKKPSNIFWIFIYLYLCTDTNSKVFSKSSASSSDSIDKIENNPNENSDLLQTCKLSHKCRTCSFDEVLTIKECEQTGQTEIYQCPSVKERVYNSCENGNFFSSIYIICGALWLFLIAGMKLFYLYKQQLELQLNIK